jgi:hypothetical protein
VKNNQDKVDEGMSAKVDQNKQTDPNVSYYILYHQYSFCRALLNTHYTENNVFF